MFTCGDNRYGKLGLSQKMFNSIQCDPVLVEKYQQLNVKNIACGGTDASNWNFDIIKVFWFDIWFLRLPYDIDGCCGQIKLWRASR